VGLVSEPVLEGAARAADNEVYSDGNLTVNFCNQCEMTFIPPSD